MSLANSINIFYKKYKKPLTILVLLFFVYKIFNYYYGNVFEGFPSSRNLPRQITFNEVTATANQLRARATSMRTQANTANESAKELRDIARGITNSAQRLTKLREATSLDDEVIKLNLEANRLDALADNK